MKRIPFLLISLVLISTACIPVQADYRRGDMANITPTMTPPPLTPPQSPTITPEKQNNVAPRENAIRITFESGKASAINSDALSAGGTREYVLSAAAGQTLHIQTVGYTAPVNITLRSPDGMTWSGEPSPSDVYIITIQAVLPEDGDYLVMLSVPLEAGDTRYDVIFSMIPNPQPTIPVSIDPPERVEFSLGSFSAQRSSLLPSGLGVKQYMLAARDGQTLTIDLTSDDVPISLTITSPSGIQLFTKACQASLANGGCSTSHSFMLAETGDYLVTLTKAEHTPSTNYTIHFTIR